MGPYSSGYGKRSADASYGASLTLQNHNNQFGHQLSSGYAISQGHPGFSGSTQQVSRIHSGLILPYSSGYGKRSADASYSASLTLQNHNNQFGHQLSSGYAISQGHPGFGGSTQRVSRLHSGLSYGGYGYLY